MSNRDHLDDRPEDEALDEARRLAVEILSSSDAALSVSRLEQASHHDLVELLLDHAETLPAEALQQALAGLALPQLIDMTQTILIQEELLLDPTKVAHSAVLRFLTGIELGERVRPFSLWIRRILEPAITWARFQPFYCVFPPAEHGTPQQKRDHEMARMVNELDSLARRIVSMAWIRHIPLQTIADVTQLPLEQVELILMKVMEGATRIHSGEEVADKPNSADEEFWQAMEDSEDDDDQS